MSYQREEQETVLVYNNADNEWDVYSTVPKHIRKLSTLTELNVLEYDGDRPIAVRGKLTEKQVGIRKERVMTEEQRQQAAERMIKARENINT
ncbi:hypothetical protein [Metabacillus fastidiosus]|uniref:hypothetical protein n=1 Tax=Metabacillus fastidiosus TaxID=1458 RepID=UPI003D2AE53F